MLERDEEQADLGVDEHVARGDEHAVAVVARERERALVEHADEARLAALVRAVRAPVLVGGGEEEHVHRLDERAVAVVDEVADLDVLEPVGEPARVEAVLEPAAAVVVEAHQSRQASRSAARPEQHEVPPQCGQVAADAAEIQPGRRPPGRSRAPASPSPTCRRSVRNAGTRPSAARGASMPATSSRGRPSPGRSRAPASPAPTCRRPARSAGTRPSGARRRGSCADGTASVRTWV